MTLTLTPTPATDLPANLTPETLETMIAHIRSDQPWGVADVEAIFSSGIVPDPNHVPFPHLTNAAVTITRFTPEAIDLLISQVQPWPAIATYSALSDLQFDRFLTHFALNPSPDADSLTLARVVNSTERLIAALVVVKCNSADYPSDRKWDALISRLITPDNLDRLIPVLPDHYANLLATASTNVPALSVSDVTPARLAALGHLDPTRVLIRLASSSTSHLPVWFLSRLILRLPGLVPELISQHQFATIYSGSYPAGYARHTQLLDILHRTIALADADVQTVMSLMNTSAALAETITAARIVSHAA